MVLTSRYFWSFLLLPGERNKISLAPSCQINTGTPVLGASASETLLNSTPPIEVE